MTEQVRMRGGMPEDQWFHQDALIVRSLRRDENLAYIEAKLAHGDTTHDQRIQLAHEQELLRTYRTRHPLRAEFRLGL